MAFCFWIKSFLKTHTRPLLIASALLALYLIWGSTYLAMKFVIESFPPVLMAAVRFILAGGLLFGWLRLRGAPNPTPPQWLGAGIVGIMLLVGGNALVAIAEQSVSSGLAALMIASVPLWMSLFSMLLLQHKPARREWIGMWVGAAGVALLSTGAQMQASISGTVLLLLAALSWSIGSIWGKRLPMPSGLMATAAQMLIGGLAALVVSLLLGEHFPAQLQAKAVWSLAYLVVFGSLLAFSAYWYLLNTVRPALATSYAFVNPVVAMLLGAWLAQEKITPQDWLALAIIVTGVVLVLPFGKKS